MSGLEVSLGEVERSSSPASVLGARAATLALMEAGVGVALVLARRDTAPWLTGTRLIRVNEETNSSLVDDEILALVR